MIDLEAVLRFADAYVRARDQYAALPSQDVALRGLAEAMVAAVNEAAERALAELGRAMTLAPSAQGNEAAIAAAGDRT